MARGVKTGGRKKGTPNKVNARVAREAASSGETPLQYMLRVMRDPTVDHERRDKLAVAASPYVHQKLSSLEVSGDPDNPVKHAHSVEVTFVRAKDA